MTQLYDELKSRKDNGEKLIMDEILTVPVLQKLWWEESIPDALIADLFDTTKEIITKRRYYYGLKQQNCMYYDILHKVLKEMKG